MNQQPERPGPLGTWLIAVRPFAFPNTALPVLLGAAVAYYAGYPVRWLPLAATVMGVLLFHSAANLLNDYWDYMRGVDTLASPGSGALVRKLLRPGQVLKGAILCLALGTAWGAYLVTVAGWMVLVLGAIGAFLTVGYTAPLIGLKNRGLGDLAVFMACGPLPAFGSYWVQAQNFAWTPLLWSVPPGLLIVAVLHANNWRDIEGDLRAGCSTPAALMGDRASAVYYYLLVLVPFALVILYVALGYGPLVALVGLAGLPLAVRLLQASGKKHASSEAERESFIALDASTAAYQLIFTLLLVIAFYAAPHLPSLG